MKRILSLALVLVMVLGMIPMALATEEEGSTTETTKETKSGATVTVSPIELEVGEDKSISITKFVSAFDVDCPVSGVELSNLESNNENIATVTTAGKVSGVAAGETTITGIATYEGEQYIHTGNFSVSVKVVAPTPSAADTNGNKELLVGGKYTIKDPSVTNYTPAEGTTLSWTWTSGNEAVATIDAGKVTAVATGTATITGTPSDNTLNSVNFTVTVSALSSVVVELDTYEVELKVGETATPVPSYTPALPDGTNASVTWASNNTRIATVNASTGKITAIAEGTCHVDATITIPGCEAVTKTVTVKVTDGAYIKCDNVSVAVDSVVKVTPSVVGVPSDATVYFSYTESSDLITISDASDKSYTKVTGKSAGVATVTVSAYYVPKDGKVSTDKVALDDITVYVGVYADHTVEVSLKSDIGSSFKFTDEKIFASAKYDGATLNVDKSLQYMLTEPDAYKIEFTESSASDNIGTWQTDPWGDTDAVAITALNGASIKLNGKQGTMILKYTITTASTKGSVIIATGTLKITAGETVADITYKTSFQTSITVDEIDFFNFYKKAGKTDTLNYVVFGAPKEGVLYTTDKETVKVKDDMKFFYRYTSTDNGYNLAELTYDPKLKTKEYVDYVEFTCYGTENRQVSGILAFEVGNNNPFTDVKESDYFYEPVMWAVGQGITNGVTDTTFCPNNACTRAQVVTFMWRAAGEPTPKAVASPFTDVKKNAYYYDAVLWAVEKGITTGLTATTFGPDAVCTRAQVVTFLHRAAGEPTATSLTAFTDVPASAYYYKAVLWAVKNGITTGMGNSTFAPNSTCTRGQIVTFLYRYAAE